MTEEDCPEKERARPNSLVLPNMNLLKQGWEPRFVTSPDRLEEAIQLYRDIGLEVRTEKIRPNDLLDQCADCHVTYCSTYVIIYTRAPS